MLRNILKNLPTQLNQLSKAYSLLPTLELQLLIHAKDELAFRTLYDRFWDKIFVICNNRVQNVEAAQDIVQDIFLSIWTHTDIRTVQNLEAYLFQATKFSVIKYFNKSARYTNVDHQLLGMLDRVEDVDIDEALHSKFLQELIFQEVERLPLRTQIIFNYSRKEHLSSKEIAEKLDISPRTVENQLSFALKQLRIFLRTLKTFIIF